METMRERLDRLETEDEISRIARDYHNWREIAEARQKMEAPDDVVSEAVKRYKQTKPCDLLLLDKDSPLYKDMEDILEREKRGEIRLYTHAEVWGE